MSQPAAIGIDLGTTFSVVAYIDETGRPKTLINSEGDLITPSVVLFEGDDIIVGKEALKAMSSEMESVADCAKRDLGERYYHKKFEGRGYPPEAIQGWVINKISTDAKRIVGPFDKVVVTVPAYFDEVRRKATQDAGFIAGLDVIDIVNEPTAAAVAYGFQHGFLDQNGKAPKPKNVLVYDLGGGTFDVTVMQIEGSDFITLATDGDVQLGGHDWDRRILDYVAEEFIRQFRTDPRDDPNTEGRLWRDCEDAKRTLSARSKSVIPCDYKGSSCRVEITRDKFEEITRDLLDRTLFTTKQTLQAAGLQWSDIERILLVGGSTRMPMVVRALHDLCGMSPDTSLAVDEVVAHGAALWAKLLLDKSEGFKPSFKVQNVNSHSLGVVGTDTSIGCERNAILIPRNTPLPVSAKRRFKTKKPNQKSILVKIVEGESADPEDCSHIGSCTVRDLPPNLPVNTSIEVRFRYLENGRLTVTVSVADTDKRLEHELERDNSLSPELLDMWRQYVRGNRD